ncbi:MFS transporter [Sphaerisporangium flaviroseum]|uniref:MFS transporter n=2 Tax=Sphaerisporangium flaviroseum TaxID=509199 RepID=A0ABP7HEA7_9ACTN
MFGLLAGVAFVNTAMVGASTAASLIASESSGPAWGGVPNAATVLGTALGALSSGTLMARHSRRFALLVMYCMAVTGGVVAFAGAVTGTLAPLLAGMVLLGLGNGGAQLSRYVAAELYPENRRGFALSAVVWGGTVGALAGPALIAPAAAGAERLGLPGLSGPVGVAVLMIAAALVSTTTLPRAVAGPGGSEEPVLPPSPVRTVLRRPAVTTALVAMVAAQVVMVALMVMTPLQLHDHGHGLDVVAWVLSAHMIGMFALAPVSGRVADRWGGRAAIGAGVVTLVLAAGTAVAVPTAHVVGLPVALFLLGYGWNLVFVGGSSLLSRDLPIEDRSRVQGVVDALVWGASGLASLSAGQLFGSGGFALVAVVAGVLALAPLPLLIRRG